MRTNKTLAKPLALSFAVALAIPIAAHADDGFSWHFSGFGTVGYVATNSDDVLLVNPGQLKGAQKGGTGLVDSRVGGQIDWAFTPKLSATTQAIAKQDARGRFRPVVSLAFLRYKFNDELTMRAGRIGTLSYLVSDYRYVGYASPWARPPLEVYNLAAVDSFEGADLLWSHPVGEGYLSFHGLAGHISQPVPDTTEKSGRLKLNQLTGLYVTYEIGSLRLRAGASTCLVSYTTSNLATLLGALKLYGFDSTYHTIVLDSTRTTFSSVGGNYDDGKLLVTGEFAHLHSASVLLNNRNGWYGTVGYHFGKWTPYVTWAGYSKGGDPAANGVPPIGPLLPLSVGAGGLLASDSQHTTSLGIRWDVMDNVSIKLQADHMRPSIRGGTFSNIAPGYDGHAVNVYSAVVDFTF